MDEGFPLECAQDANTLRRMKKQHLVELAQSYGLDTGGLKETLVLRISDWATKQVWLQTTGQEAAMDPSPPAAQPAATLKRVASSLGFYQDSTPPKTQTQEDNSMQEGWSPGTDYTRRYSFLPEDSIASVHDAEASFSSADSRPAIRSIPSRLSLALDGAASADMLLDEVPDPAKASSIFASASNTDTVSRDHPPPPEFGNESLVASQFDFKSPETAPSMPVGPSFAGLFHAFMGNSKDKKPDRFAAAHEAQFSRMKSIAPNTSNANKRKNPDDEQEEQQPKAASITSKQSLMSRSIDSLRSATSGSKPETTSVAFAAHSAKPSKKARKSANIFLPDAPPPEIKAQSRYRFMEKQRAKHRSSVPGERKTRKASQPSNLLKSSLMSSTQSMGNGPLPRYATPTTAFQAKIHNVPSGGWLTKKVKSSFSSNIQPPLAPRFGVSKPKESNGVVIIGHAKPHYSIENGMPDHHRDHASLPRFAAGTESSRAKAHESPNKRQRMNQDKPLPLTPGRNTAAARARARRQNAPTTTRQSPRKQVASGSLSRPRPVSSRSGGFFASGPR